MCVEEYKSVNLRKKVTKFRHSLNTKQALSREYAFFFIPRDLTRERAGSAGGSIHLDGLTGFYRTLVRLSCIVWNSL
jgi:hypothetical protein